MDAQYVPDVATRVERYLVGTAANDEVVRSRRSPSIHGSDRVMLLQDLTDAVTGHSVDDLRLSYDSRSHVGLATGQGHLLAMAGDRCVGVLRVVGKNVQVPGAGDRDVQDFA